MRSRTLIAFGMVCLVAIVGLAIEEQTEERTIWFGLGGSTIGLYVPDLWAVNTFLSSHGFGVFGETLLFTGGRGRGGALGGLSIGGIGWSCERKRSTDNRYAELAIGFGGLELGWVIGGDESSLLTLGGVLGGGGTSITLVEALASQGVADTSGICGVVPTPIVLSKDSAFFAIEPFVSLQAQPMHSFGFELHLGYLLPLFTYEWGDAELDGVSPKLSGPVIAFSATWGAIGRPAIGPLLDRPKVEEMIEQIVLLPGTCIKIDNAVGRIAVEGSDDAGGGERHVRIVALKRAHSQTIVDQVSVLIEPTQCGVTIHSSGPRRSYWEMEYTIFVPAGIEVIAKQAAGDVRIVNIDGDVSVDLGLGEIEVSGVVGEALSINSGAGDILVSQCDLAAANLVLGTGSIEIVLEDDASYQLVAEAGIGEISVGPFVGFDQIEADGLGCSIEATLGAGEGELSIHLGVGEIGVRATPE